MREVFNQNKIQILAETEKFFLRFDGGTVVSDIREFPITEEEFQKLIQMETTEDTFVFLKENCRDRLLHARRVFPDEDIGNVGALF